jgi:hemerythrin
MYPMKNSLNYVDWDNKYLIGIASIDAQHQHFVSMMNRLFLEIQSDGQSTITQMINDLVDYADQHFSLEEYYFNKYSYPLAKLHIAEHHKIKRKIIKLLNENRKDQFKLGYLLLDLLDDWFFNHIVKVDALYVGFMKQKGIY